MSHNLRKIKGGWQCQVCYWNWQSKPKTQCPGVRRYSWDGKPDHLQTKTELGENGLKLAPDQKVVGIVQSGTGKDWWHLYDRTEAVPKRKLSPASKSTRVPCPIGFDCLLVAAERGKPCPNKHYCANQAAPWNLPYKSVALIDGTHRLEVKLYSYNYGHSAAFAELESLGWGQAVQLPFRHINGVISKPMLVVYHPNDDQKACGWEEAIELRADYLRWRAAALGMPYAEWSESDWYRAECALRYESGLYEDPLNEQNLPEYPHCILPPTLVILHRSELS